MNRTIAHPRDSLSSPLNCPISSGRLDASSFVGMVRETYGRSLRRSHHVVVVAGLVRLLIMNDTSFLGRMEKVDLRTVWKTEAGDFTPWLATEANIALLGDTIGIDLEVEAQEK